MATRVLLGVKPKVKVKKPRPNLMHHAGTVWTTYALIVFTIQLCSFGFMIVCIQTSNPELLLFGLYGILFSGVILIFGFLMTLLKMWRIYRIWKRQ